MDDVYIAWRIAMSNVWRVPWTTYCNLLPHHGPGLWFSKRGIKLINMALKIQIGASTHNPLSWTTYCGHM